MKSKQIKQKAHELGFELVGITKAHPTPDYDFFRWWLNQNYGATMSYLQRGAEKRRDPSKILPEVKSIICCGMNYYTELPQGPISNYVWGEDYHDVVGTRLRSLEKFIVEEIDSLAKTKSYVDTGPILERSYAAQAGLGWIGKNTCLINNGLGSFVFLGEILTTLELSEEEYDRPALDQCGTCSKCMEACPTGALNSYVMDANRCISYLTIEHRGDFTSEQEGMIQGHLYGCDICQQVCPYNEKIPTTPLEEFQPRERIQKMDSQKAVQINEKQFLEMIENSAMKRIKYAQWQRNLTGWRLTK